MQDLRCIGLTMTVRTSNSNIFDLNGIYTLSLLFSKPLSKWQPTVVTFCELTMLEQRRTLPKKVDLSSLADVKMTLRVASHILMSQLSKSVI